MGYVVQLDGIRGLALLLVMLWHYTRFSAVAGAVGVELFFVLSSFLVTKSLLSSAARQRPASHSLVAFYVRRHARLTPALYVMLLMAVIMDLPNARESAGWAATYVLNMHIFESHMFPDTLAHLWYLAAQEQVYLLLPVAVVGLRRRELTVVAILCCVVGPVARYVANVRFGYVLPFAHLDGIGLGMLLALGFRGGPMWSAQATGMALLASIIINAHIPYEAGYVVGGALVAGWAAWLVMSAAESDETVAAVLSARWLVWLGRISYSVFLVHLAMPHLTVAVMKWMGVSGTVGTALFPALSMAEAILVGWLLWRAIEVPAARLVATVFERPRSVQAAA